MGHTRGGGGGLKFFLQEIRGGQKKKSPGLAPASPPPSPTTLIDDRSLNRHVFNGKFFFYNKKAEIYFCADSSPIPTTLLCLGKLSAYQEKRALSYHNCLASYNVPSVAECMPVTKREYKKILKLPVS